MCSAVPYPVTYAHRLCAHAPRLLARASSRRQFQSADYVAPYTVFNVGGNSYRLIALIRYDTRQIYIRGVVTHADYDRWCDDYRRG